MSMLFGNHQWISPWTLYSTIGPSTCVSGYGHAWSDLLYLSHVYSMSQILLVVYSFVTFLYHRSTPSPSPSVLWRSRRCKQLSITLPSVHLLVPSRFHFPSFPTLISLCHYHSSWPVLCQCTLSPHHFTIWTQHSQRRSCMELLPRWLISPYVCFSLPHGCFMHHMVFQFYYFFILWGLFP